MELRNVPGPKAKAILARDRQVITPAVARVADFVMSHGKGAEVWDVDGYRYVDLIAGIAVNSTGHSHPKVVKAIQEQAEKFLHISADYYHELWTRLAERLNEIAPFEEPAMVFLANSGAESVEAALKVAKNYTKRKFFIAFLSAFHGRTMGALAFTASKAVYRANYYPWMPGVIHVPYPDAYRPVLASKPGEDYGETVVRYIEEQILDKVVPPDEVAGIIVEPIQGEGGYVVPPDGFFPALRKLCDKYGILLIDDEVQAGMGRTGKWWAIQHWGVEPDIVCSAKGIASGVPMGAIIGRKHIMETWPPGAHGNTYGGNPLASAAALATIDLIEQEYMQNAAELGAYALERLQEMAERHPHIGQVRGKGLMLGVDFVRDRESREYYPEFRNKIVDYTFRLGALMMGCGKSTIRLAPPLAITKPLLDEGLEIFEEAIRLTEKDLG